MKRALLFTLAMVAGGFAQASCEVNEAGFANVSGQYVALTVDAPDTKHELAWIYQNKNSLIVYNGISTTTGTVTGMKVNVPGFSATGTLTNNCSEIVWSNGTAWINTK